MFTERKIGVVLELHGPRTETEAKLQRTAKWYGIVEILRVGTYSGGDSKVTSRNHGLGEQN